MQPLTVAFTRTLQRFQKKTNKTLKEKKKKKKQAIQLNRTGALST